MNSYDAPTIKNFVCLLTMLTFILSLMPTLAFADDVTPDRTTQTQPAEKQKKEEKPAAEDGNLKTDVKDLPDRGMAGQNDNPIKANPPVTPVYKTCWFWTLLTVAAMAVVVGGVCGSGYCRQQTQASGTQPLQATDPNP